MNEVRLCDTRAKELSHVKDNDNIAPSMLDSVFFRPVHVPGRNWKSLVSRTEPQSVSPLAPLGIEAAMKAKEDPNSVVRPKIFDEFALTDRVGLVSGGNRGLGLEMAIALAEAGARVVYCFDLPKEPSEEFKASREYVSKLGNGSRLEYFCADVRNQELLWKKAEEIGDKEQRFDFCIAAAGILKTHVECLEYPGQEFRDVMEANTTGVLFTAQAAGRQMARFGRGGSIILIASMSGRITNRVRPRVSYNTSEQRIRVNTLSPGYFYTQMTTAYLDKEPHLFDKWSGRHPLGRLGRPDELRGVVTWLASDASSFCTGSDILVSGGHHAW
ncbi:hypothetical protein L210DRAFT_3619435 [Boletus edulis BED1]|uniref:Sorbose reductase sou1 n=1 Tax=Boletus edulis BED1 TaxID=1328754 RepID=A0AAD4C4V6_BOLED|nr:hypothetical protein L210DRAFT_3619435 [Boletus edulis BED1]